MERRLKERLIGASVLVMLAVILIPMVLDDTSKTETHITETNIPARPEEGFTSRIVPLPDPASKAPHENAQAAAPQNNAEAPRPVKETPAAETSPAKKPAETPVVQAPVAKPAPQVAAAAAPPDRVGLAAWVVQLGSFASEENAKSLSQRLRQANYAAFVEPTGEGGDRAFRVRVGPELLKSDAQALADRLKANMHLEGIVMAYP